MLNQLHKSTIEIIAAAKPGDTVDFVAVGDSFREPEARDDASEIVKYPLTAEDIAKAKSETFDEQ